MKLKIFHTGHAGFIINFQDKILICDHWSDTYHPFEGSWRKLEKDDFSSEVTDFLENPDFIWCSHEHGDHYDPTYIRKHGNKGAKIIVPNFLDQSFVNRIIADGCQKENILLLSDLETIELAPNFNVTMIFEEPVYSNHSSLIIKTNEFKFMHNADTTPNSYFYDKIRDLSINRLDLFAGQYCNPTPYPWMIDMDNFEKESEAIEFHHSAIQSYCQMCKKLNVEESIPCAGPAIVPNYDISLYPKANELIYNKRLNLSLIESNLEFGTVLDMKSNDSLEYDV